MDAASLIEDLRRLGVRAGDTIMVHASMRAIGGPSRSGGAAAMVTAMDNAVTSDGMWLMVLGTIEAGPGVMFDHLGSVADPEVGMLAEYVRQQRGTIVNNHPEARFAARGRTAETFLSGLPWHHYHGPGSALERLCDAGGRVLRLGADLDTVTLLHHAEYLAPVPHKRRVRRHSVVAGPAGPEAVYVDCLDDSNGIVDWPGEDYFATITRDYLDAGRALAVGRVGFAVSELIDAADLLAFGVEWMTDRFCTETSSSVIDD